MGHMTPKDRYRELGKKIDSLTFRVPWNGTLHEILKELYTADEADLVIMMPYGLSPLARIAKLTNYDEARLRNLLEGLCRKGLVVDLFIEGEYRYMPSPFVIGIFEFTMMRTGGNLDIKKMARLFYEYFHHEHGALHAANFGEGGAYSIMRALPYEESVRDLPHVEILDYEKATEIVRGWDRFAIGTCSCRHEKLHAGHKHCDNPLDTCSTFGYSADYWIRNGLAREVSKGEMLANIERSRDLGLVFNADNVQRNVTFICQCCKCCCNALQAINTYGYTQMMVTSTFIARIDDDACTGCGKCAKECAANAIEMVPVQGDAGDKKKRPVLDESFCLGCGVCTMHCKPRAIMLEKRGQRVIHPETTFERVILQTLEKGTLQNQIFDNPMSVTQDVMRAFLGGVLRLKPVKRALLGDRFRSIFIKQMKAGSRLLGKEWALKL
ncbi:MAG: 4Fe-4S dicluster domain-containing protein [Spirochaetes bacterium]|nr:MAG: 4Fe-4S dicluster domain-containing protein [Spirochaetota bacterium]